MAQYVLREPVIAEEWSADHPGAVDMWAKKDKNHQGRYIPVGKRFEGIRDEDKPNIFQTKAILNKGGSWCIPNEGDMIIQSKHDPALEKDEPLWIVMSRQKFDEVYTNA